MDTSKGEGNGRNLERKRGDNGENEAQMKEAISAESQKGTEHEIWPQHDLWLDISSFFLTSPSLSSPPTYLPRTFYNPSLLPTRHSIFLPSHRRFYYSSFFILYSTFSSTHPTFLSSVSLPSV